MNERFVVVGMRKRTYEASEAAKREICAALKALMAQKPLNKITVAEIMQSCGMVILFRGFGMKEMKRPIRRLHALHRVDIAHQIQ